MKRFFGKLNNNEIIFEEGEAGHIRQVLRLKVGDNIIGQVNDEYDYYCTLTEIGKNRAVAKIEKKEKCIAIPKKEITLFQAMPKRDYFEAIVTKSIELGVSKIVPFISKFAVNHEFKKDRINQIAITACKQCERSILPEVSSVVSFDEMLNQIKSCDIVIFANEYDAHNGKAFNLQQLQQYHKIALIVGCEAGFSEEEVTKIQQAKVVSVSLGNRILRCDTAATALMAIVNAMSGN